MSDESGATLEFGNSEVIDLRRHNDDEVKQEKVKDNWWDDSEEDEKPDEAAVDESQPANVSKSSVPKPAKKKTAKEKAAEKEAEKKREQEMIRQQLAAANRTPEEIAEEMRRIREEQEKADWDGAKDTFGGEGADLPRSSGVIDNFEPRDVESFDQFRKLLVQKIEKSQSSQYYSGFLNSLFQDLSLHMPVEDIRKFGSTLTTLAGEKAKQEKPVKAKAKAKKKPGLSGAKKDDSMATYDDDYDEMDDMF